MGLNFLTAPFATCPPQKNEGHLVFLNGRAAGRVGLDFLTAPFATCPPQARDAPTVGVIATGGMKNTLFPEQPRRGARGFGFPHRPVRDVPAAGARHAHCRRNYHKGNEGHLIP